MYFFNGESSFLYVLAGGVCFASVYMVTDMATSPYTKIGLIFYSILIAVLTYFIRKFTSQPEGVTYAILIANICVPTINKYTLPRSFGGKHNMKKVLVFLTTITAVFALSYGVFKFDELIEQYEIKKETEIRDEKLEDFFGKGVKTGDSSEAKLSDEGYYFQPINKDDELVGYVVTFESKGYSTDMVKIIMGIDLDGVITGLEVLEHNETLGLGAQIQSKEWTSLWQGRDLTYEFDKSVDAYTGATFTFLNAYKKIMAVLESYEFALMDDLDDFDFEEESENLETITESESEAGDA
jgi:Na+-translocating ferredoxin:NAD+ oxidoreductase RnfG subunit